MFTTLTALIIMPIIGEKIIFLTRYNLKRVQTVVMSCVDKDLDYECMTYTHIKAVYANLFCPIQDMYNRQREIVGSVYGPVLSSVYPKDLKVPLYR